MLSGLLFGLAAAGKRKKASRNTEIVIVLLHGRSGSTELCTLLSHIANSTFEVEMFGSNPKTMHEIPDPLAHMQTFLLTKQKQFPGRAVGFKWKPYVSTTDYAPSVRFCAVATSGRRSPPNRRINTRNEECVGCH